MAEADDVDEEEVNQKTQHNEATYESALHLAHHLPVLELHVLRISSLSQNAEIFLREGEQTPHYEQRDHEEESGVDSHPEILNDPVPKERDVRRVGTEIEEESAGSKFNNQSEVAEGQSRSSSIEGRSLGDEIVGLVISSQLISNQLLEHTTAVTLLLRFYDLRYPILNRPYSVRRLRSRRGRSSSF